MRREYPKCGPCKPRAHDDTLAHDETLAYGAYLGGMMPLSHRRSHTGAIYAPSANISGTTFVDTHALRGDGGALQLDAVEASCIFLTDSHITDCNFTDTSAEVG